MLNHWFQLNREYPYPDDERTDQLANEAGNEANDLFPTDDFKKSIFFLRYHSETGQEMVC